MKREINAIGVFCGSASGSKPIYVEKAAALGKLLAKENITIVNGAGNIGLMGALNDAGLAAGGRITGVITKKLVDVEVAHKELTTIHVVETMAERKAIMERLSDAFIVLPGGFGTMDEFFDVLTLNQLGLIKKPIGILNVEGYFDSLLKLVKKFIEERFLRLEHSNMFIINEDEKELLKGIRNFVSVDTLKWLENFKTNKF